MTRSRLPFAVALLTAVAAHATPTTFGTDFWGCDMDHLPGQQEEPLAYVVLNPGPSAATVTVSTAAGVLDGAMVAAGASWTFRTDHSRMLSGTQVRPWAYHVSSTTSVAVFQWNPLDPTIDPTPDASLLLPVEMLGTQHRVFSYQEQGGSMFQERFYGTIAVVALATEPTNVTVVPSCATQAGDLPATAAGGTLTFTLHRFDVAEIASGGDLQDLTGSLVTSDRPLAVFSGSPCMDVPRGITWCDHLEQQWAPTWTCGRRFVAVKSAPRAAEPDLWRILALSNGTTVTFDPPSVSSPVVLAAGAFAEVSTTSDFVVSADQPVEVAQYLEGAAAADGRTGDPSLVATIPEEQWAQDGMFYSPAAFTVNDVAVVTTQGATATLDGVAIPPASFAPVGSGNEVRAVVQLATTGVHRVQSTAPGSVEAYGYSDYGSYGHPAMSSGAPVGTPVRCDAGAPQSLPCTAAQVTLDGSHSTTPGTAAYLWSSLSPGLTILSPTSAVTQATVAGVGQYVASLVVTDGADEHACLTRVNVTPGSGVPGEVSASGASHPLRVAKVLPGSMGLAITFGWPGISGQSADLYVGVLGRVGFLPYDHAPASCWSAPAPAGTGIGRLDASFDPGLSHYYLVSASTCSGEGTRGYRSDGVERPQLPTDCGPSP